LQVRGRALEERLRCEDTRVVHQHVDAAEALACGGRPRACGGRVADVARQGEDPRRVAKAPAGALELVGVAAVDDQAGPAGQERASHVEADAASGAGDDYAVDAIGHGKSPFALTATAVDQNKKMVCGHGLHNCGFCIVRRMTYDQLVALTTVAAEGTFTGVSEALHKSQPAVSKLIRNLEGELGVVLFDRTRYRATLTDSGRVFYERAAAVIESTHALRGFGLALGGKVEPIVRLAVEAVTPLDPIVKILRDVEARFPSVRLELHTERLAGAAEALHERRADVVVATMLGIDAAKVDAKPFGRVRIVAVARADHPVATRRPPIPPALLRRHPQIVLRD